MEFGRPCAGSLYGSLMNMSVNVIGVIDDYFIYVNTIFNEYGFSGVDSERVDIQCNAWGWGPH